MSDTSVNHHPIPAVLPNETPGSCPPPEVHALLTDVFFAPLRAIVKTSGIIRKCICLDDITFAILCVLRALQSSKTGRDFLQTHAIPQVPELTRSNYFASLSSKRRLTMMQGIARHLRSVHLPTLRAHDDLLTIFPELKNWEVWAVDGHQIAHATHDPRNGKDQYSPVSAIYRLDSRTGWAEFTALVKPTAKGLEHEIITLRRLSSEALRCGAGKGQHTLISYDRAIIDFVYAYNLKQCKSTYIITQWKSNLAPLTAIPRAIDRNNPANLLVLRDETVMFDNTPGTWRRITSKCTDSDEIFVVLTNEMTLPPGVLCETYRLRWRIEKSFDQQEQKLDERKAWATSDTAKTIQVISICIANNLLQLFKATLKTEEGIEDTKVIKAYHKDLDRREANAKKSGRPFPKALFLDLYRPTELSLQFIRWLRTALTIPTCYRQALERLHPLMESYL